MNSLFYSISVTDFFLIATISGGFCFFIWYAGAIISKVERNSRDINAIAARLRILETDTLTRLTAFDFTLKTLVAEKTGIQNTEFNLETLRSKQSRDL
jgi:hypothetical protein